MRSAQCGRGAGLRAGGNGRGFPAGPGAELRGPRPRGARFRAPPDGSVRCAPSRFSRRIVPFVMGWEVGKWGREVVVVVVGGVGGGRRFEGSNRSFPPCSYLLHRAAGLLHRPQSAFLQLLLAAGPRPFLPAANLTSVIQAFVILQSVGPRTRPPGNQGEGREMGTRPPLPPLPPSPLPPPNPVTGVPLVANVAFRSAVPRCCDVTCRWG